jgi:hypothetical protein
MKSLIETVSCKYGTPVHTKPRFVPKEFRLKARRRAKEALTKFKEHMVGVKENDEPYLKHPAPRIYNLDTFSCWFRYKGPNFVRCTQRKDGRIDLS